MSAHFASLRGDRNSNEDNHNIIIGMGAVTDATQNKGDGNKEIGNKETGNKEASNKDAGNKEANNKEQGKEGKEEKIEPMANINYYGVYDGHGGKFVSKFLSENIFHYFIDPKVKYPLDKEYVNKVFDGVQNILVTKYTKQATECGSTCLIVCHFKSGSNDYLNILNTGDSRCVLSRNNIAHTLTRDHKPDWPDEKWRIKKLGGQVKKVGNTFRIGDLSVSRAFGDIDANKYVTHRPDIYKYKIKKKDRFIIIACDGLWDVVSPQDAVNFVLDKCYDSDMKRINVGINIADELAKFAIESESGDNVTCIVVLFN